MLAIAILVYILFIIVLFLVEVIVVRISLLNSRCDDLACTIKDVITKSKIHKLYNNINVTTILLIDNNVIITYLPLNEVLAIYETRFAINGIHLSSIRQCVFIEHDISTIHSHIKYLHNKYASYYTDMRCPKFNAGTHMYKIDFSSTNSSHPLQYIDDIVQNYYT